MAAPSLPHALFALGTYCPATGGRPAARVEEVVVGANGPEILTKFPALGAGAGVRGRRQLLCLLVIPS
jgi:hypothetical protein